MSTPILIEYIYFAICAFVALAGGLGTVAFPNPIRGALSLLFSIVAIAGIYLQLQAPFLAAIQLIVYAGAVVVLFLFVIMLIGPDAVPPKDSRGTLMRTVGGLAASFIALQIVVVVAKRIGVRWPYAQKGYGSIDAVGAALFNEYLIPFEVASLLLLVAVIGAVAVGQGKSTTAESSKLVGSKTEPKTTSNEQGEKQ